MLCSDLVICSQEQWDIYKLDTLYDCYVPPHPNIPMISRLGPPPAESISTRPRKRRARSPVSENSLPKQAKKYRKTGPKAEEPASTASTTTTASFTATTASFTATTASAESQSSTTDTITPSASHPQMSAKSKGKRKATVEDEDEVTSIPTSWFTDFAHEGASTAPSATPFPSAFDMPAKGQALSAAPSFASAMSIVEEDSFVPSGAPFDPSASGAAPAPFPDAFKPSATSFEGGFTQPGATPHKQKVTRDPSIIDLTMEDAFEDTPTPTPTPNAKRPGEYVHRCATSMR